MKRNFLPLLLLLPLLLIYSSAGASEDLGPEARAALTLNPSMWHEKESDHFKYYFRDSKAAEAAMVHAEAYYKAVKDIFKIENDSWSAKGSIFIFSSEEEWNNFQTRIHHQTARVAFTTGTEVFLFNHAYWLATPGVLAHELTHLVFFRFLDGPVPLFLHEGFSEFISAKILSLKADGDMYRLGPVQLMKDSDWIDLKNLAAMETYPEDKQSYYKECELLVRFMVTEYPKTELSALLKEVSRGTSFEEAVTQIYGLGFETFAQKFKTFAIKKGE